MVVNGQNAETGSRQPPGVYFDFVPRLVPSLRRRSDIAGFAGFTLSESEKPFVCNNFQDFIQRSGGSSSEGYLGDAVRGFFLNGGRTCWVAPALQCDVHSATSSDPRKCALERAIDRLAEKDEVALIAAPDAGLCGSRRLQLQQALVMQAERLRDRIALLDPPQDWIVRQDWESCFPVSDSALAALYWPWLRIPSDTPSPDGEGYTRCVPPSGHIAGTIARRDIERGVFAPPANIVIEGVVGVADQLTREVRADVNDAGINVIVALPGRGIRAMGARTLNKDNREYRWLNVRRLVTHLCEWIAEDTLWTVFEPQGEVLWRAIERLVRTILFDLWRRGGLVGAIDDQAYFVRCDRTTNPPEEAEQGRVICVIGLRPPPPAEMITVRVGIAEGRVELLDREVPNG